MKPQEPERPWSATVVETLQKNPYFSVLLQHVTVTDGTHRDYYTVDFPRPAVGIIARRGGNFLLLRQYRFIVDEFVWAIPSGGVAESETPAAAAARELEEETGYRAESLVHLMYCYASYGCSNQRFEIFLAEGLIETGNVADANEVLGVKWFSHQDLLGLLLTNGVVANWSLSPLLLILLREALPQPNTE